MLQQMDQPLHQCELQLQCLFRKSLCNAATLQEKGKTLKLILN